MPLTQGSRLGSYEVLAPLGAGGVWEVYRARDVPLSGWSRSRPSAASLVDAHPRSFLGLLHAAIRLRRRRKYRGFYLANRLAAAIAARTPDFSRIALTFARFSFVSGLTAAMYRP